MTKIVSGSGPLNAKIWVIGSTPTSQDLAENTPFASRSGEFFRKKLYVNNINPTTDVRFELLYPERVAGGKFVGIEDQGKIGTYAEELKRKIEENRPNIVILVGEQPLKYILGRSGISKWRGHYLFTDSGIKCLATHDPFTALRQRNVDKKNRPGQYESLMTFDVGKAVRGSVCKGWRFHEYERIIQPTYSDAVGLLREMRDNAKILSFDIETDSHSFIDCISFCDGPSRSFCLPLYIMGGRTITPYWEDRDQFSTILRLVRELLSSSAPKIAQNGQFDMLMLAYYYKIQTRNFIWDTMIAAHNLYCDLPKDLGNLVALYTNLEYEKYLGAEHGSRNRWLYNASDSMATLMVMKGQIKEMQNAECLDHYRNVTNPIIIPCMKMQETGVKVDLELNKISLIPEMHTLEYLRESFSKIFPHSLDKDPAVKFNPGSYQQRNRLFYDIFGIKKMYTNGSVSTDKTHLAEIGETSNSRCIRILAEACLRYGAAQAMAGKLSTPLLNGRLHSKYGIGGDDEGTETGRLNSKESDLKVWSE